MAKYCCTLPYISQPYPLENCPVRGLPSKNASSGMSSTQPMPQPSRLSSARWPNSRPVSRTSPLATLHTK